MARWDKKKKPMMLKNNVKQQISIETIYIFQNIQNIMALIKKPTQIMLPKILKGFKYILTKKRFIANHRDDNVKQQITVT